MVVCWRLKTKNKRRRNNNNTHWYSLHTKYNVKRHGESSRLKHGKYTVQKTVGNLRIIMMVSRAYITIKAATENLSNNLILTLYEPHFLIAKRLFALCSHYKQQDIKICWLAQGPRYASNFVRPCHHLRLFEKKQSRKGALIYKMSKQLMYPILNICYGTNNTKIGVKYS